MTDVEKIALYEERLEKIDSLLSGISDNNIEQYTINGRELKKYSIPDLIQLSKHFQNKLTSLKNKNKSRKILTRFL